ncbi:g2484 [Coccomyxa elongata]
MQVDLSCSESGEDLSNGFDSPRWPSAEAGITRIHTRSHTPPIAMEDVMSILGEDNFEVLMALLADEGQYRVTSRYMSAQSGVGPEHRHFLVSWIMTAACHHNFGAFTSALAVNLLDRYLAAQPASDGELWTLQLAAVACLSVAAKMEEGVFPDNIAMFQVDIPWEPFEPRYIKNMELVVLATLEWRVAAVTAASFLDRMLLGAFEAAGLDSPSMLHASRTKSMAILTKTLPEERYLDFRPSTVAAAAILVAMRMYCTEQALHTAEAYLRSLTTQVEECRGSLTDDFIGDRESSPSSPYRDELFEKGGASNPTPTSVLQLEEALSGELPPRRERW